MEQGGVESVVCDLNRALAARGWESVVVSRGGRLVERIVRDGGRHVAMDLKSKNPLTYFARARALRRILEAERPDVVCAHSRVPAWLFVGAARGLGQKWITYAHGANSVSRYSKVMTAGDLVVAPSRFISDFLQRSYGTDPAKIRVIPNAVDTVRFDPAAVDRGVADALREKWGVAGRRVVMAVGRITPVKGLDVLIDAFSRLGLSDAALVVVGSADADHAGYERRLRSLAESLGVGGRVVFAGAQDRVPECLSLADVVVSSNVRKPESFGLSAAEAMAMGKPVVAKGFGGMAEVVEAGKTGVLVPADSPDFAAAFAAAIGDVLADPGRFDAKTLRSSVVSRFNFDIMSDNTVSAYESAIREGNRR